MPNHPAPPRQGTSGSLWEIETYDRIIRDEEHLYRVIQYIGRDPTKCGFARKNETCWVHPEWSQAGFGFEEVALRLPVPPD